VKRSALVSDCFVGIKYCNREREGESQTSRRWPETGGAGWTDVVYAVVEHELDPRVREDAQQRREMTL
jgi:hypothetical protein